MNLDVEPKIQDLVQWVGREGVYQGVVLKKPGYKDAPVYKNVIQHIIRMSAECTSKSPIEKASVGYPSDGTWVLPLDLYLGSRPDMQYMPKKKIKSVCNYENFLLGFCCWLSWEEGRRGGRLNFCSIIREYSRIAIFDCSQIKRWTFTILNKK